MDADPDQTPTPSSAAGRPSPWGLIASIVAAVVIVGGALVIAAGMGTDDQPAAESPIGADGDTGTTQNPLIPTVDLTGQPAPTTPFETFEGGTAAFADYAGKPVVVNFFSSTCAPCLQEMPDFETVKQAHEGEVVFLGMNVADSVESGLNVVERTGVTWELGRDPTGEILSELGALGMPTTMVLRADGTIASIKYGQLSAAELEERIADAQAPA